jgi:hypothetical protein
MDIKRAAFMTLLGFALAALAMPLAGLRAASGSAASSVRATAKTAPFRNSGLNAPAPQSEQQREVLAGETSEGKISASTLNALGLTRAANPQDASNRIGQRIQESKKKPGSGEVTIQSGQPTVLDARSALSSALITTIGGRDNRFSEVTLIADWDGREDCAADREQKQDEFPFGLADHEQTLTRAAISEHTMANGFAENVLYYGDSLGNLWVGTDTNPGINVSPFGAVDSLLEVSIPVLVNTGASGGFSIPPGSLGCTDDQVTVTGIAVQPVADLGDFGLGRCGTIGEVVYVSIFDSEGCSSNAANQPIRTRIFAFAFTDGVGVGAMTPAGVRQVFSSALGNIAGVALDDDGSLYFHLVDLIQFTGGAIFKAAPIPHVPGTGCSLRSTRVVPSIPTLGLSSMTPLSSASVRVTNYSSGVPGKAGVLTPLFGDIVAIATGACNVLYAALSPSFVAPGDSTQGLFPAPSAFTSGTPSMIISFADCSGAFDVCSGEAAGSVTMNVGGVLPVGDGYADVATSTAGALAPGVNNYRLFALGNGPDIRPAPGGTAIVPGTLASVLRLDMQIDYTAHSGLAVNEENTVFVISGGTPAGIGKNPSPMVGEVLCFEDQCPADRRADFVDLRGDSLPSPPASGGNVGDGDSDRFDHIFFQAPLDQSTLTPAGLAGLARGFLRYPVRLAPSPIGPGVTLGVTKRWQFDDDTDGPITFENLDPGHQVAGGDDQNTPFRGDDDDGAGNPVLAGALSGGFEFLFGGPVGGANCVWNGFFLNSNGNITFGVGNTSRVPNVPDFRQGPARIAPAWTDLNPSAREIDLRTFPVQALGFANVNAFKVRWINVPQSGSEGCTGSGSGFSNTFAVTLYDDGTGIDENANQPFNPNPIGNNAVPFDLQEGPTDLRFTRVNFTNPTGGSFIVGCSPRREGSGIFIFEYCRMDLLGTADFPVIAGYSIGGLDPLNPPGLCETNLSVAAAAADQGTFGVLAGGQIAAVGCNCCIGEGTEPTIFELFNEGSQAGTGSGGEITFAKPDFDLRFEGNDAALCTSSRQRDANRGKVCFLGIGCAPPSNPICQAVVAGTFVTTPTTTGLVNAICQVPLNLVGCGFFPNEVTTICQGFEAETGVPLQRPGKTVTTAATLTCDTNGDGIAESVVVLTSVTPVSCNLITATIPVTASLPGTGFPAACCGGPATITVTTTFTAGDNNAFGPFTRTTVCPLALGNRAPVVFSATPSTQTCNGLEDLLITGACFQFVGLSGTPPAATTFSVTSVFLQDKATGAIILPCAPFTIINNNLIDVNFCLTRAQAGHSYLVFVTNAFGTSRNLTGPVTGQPGAPCPTTGNEAGIQVMFACNGDGTIHGDPTPLIPTVTGCHLGRQDTGQFFLDVTGTNIKPGATATVGGVTPKKIKVIAVEPGTNIPTALRLVKKVCNGLPGNVIITNTVAGGGRSQPFLCTEMCPTQ